MDRATEEALSLFTSIMIFAALLSLTIMVSIHFFLKDWAGFGSFKEKSANVTTAEIIPQERIQTRDDAMLMLAVADENTPTPKLIDINGTQIVLDSVYFGNRLMSMQIALAVMPNNVPYTHTLYIGPSGPRYWKFVER